MRPSVISGWTPGVARSDSQKSTFSTQNPPWALLRPVARPARWVSTLRSPMVSRTPGTSSWSCGVNRMHSTCPTMSIEVVVTRNSARTKYYHSELLFFGEVSFD